MPADQMLLTLLLNFGWMPIAVVFLWGVFQLWMDYIQDKWASEQKFKILAVDIPKSNNQLPKAVENIFSYLAGAHGTKNLLETYWEGQFQLTISLEIVSIDGYTQFLIHAPEANRNLIESAVYSQYPDAEITEVNDYTENMPDKYPDSEYDLFGAEFMLADPVGYPIKTYNDFLSDVGKPEEQFKDPMASLMDLCSSLKPGEQLWQQIIILPILDDHIKPGEDEIKKIMNDYSPTETIFDKMIKFFLSILENFSEAVYSLWGDIETKEPEKSEPLQMMNLRPKQKKQVEAIQRKISQIGFGAKIRMIYVAKKDVMVKPKAVNGFVGYMKQFTDYDLNSFKPDMTYTATTGAYLFKDQRINMKKNKIMKNYKGRSYSGGRKAGYMSVEELATLWHFPVEGAVKAPMIQKAPGRKSEPPMALPLIEDAESDKLFSETKATDSIFSDTNINSSLEKYDKIVPGQEEVESGEDEMVNTEDAAKESIETIKKDKVEKKGSPPSNLPFE